MENESENKNNSNYRLKVFIDRYDKNYQDEVNHLLSYDQLFEKAGKIRKNNIVNDKYSKVVSIKFCGLSGHTILGGLDVPDRYTPKGVASLLNLMSNQNDTIAKLNEAGIYVDIKIMFAYPYSDFVYDLIHAERSNQEGFSINDIIENKQYDYRFSAPKKLTYEDLRRSLTYQHLLGSLDKIQEAVNKSGKHFNHIESFNRLIVKFAPLNILNCFLKINNYIFFDPYLYARESERQKYLALTSPITSLSIPEIPSNLEVLDEQEIKIYRSYCSLLSHFKHLWHHPLTLYSTDATDYDKGINETLSTIREPRRISYLGKSQRIEEIQKKRTDIHKCDVDLWRQYCKNELLRYCSKFVINKDFEFKRLEQGQINLNPIPIFFVGSWKKGDTNRYVNSLKEFFDSKFAESNTEGLKIKPVVIDIDDASEIHKLIYENLNACQLGIVIQTLDYLDNSISGSKPNVYFEKGYLMGRLGRWQSKLSGKKKEMVFIFNEENLNIESDIINIKQSSFTSLEDFEIQFYSVIKWIWEVTELNSYYALKILHQYQEKIVEKLKHNPKENLLLQRHLRKVNEFIKEITKWQEEYERRIENLKNL